MSHVTLSRRSLWIIFCDVFFLFRVTQLNLPFRALAVIYKEQLIQPEEETQQEAEVII